MSVEIKIRDAIKRYGDFTVIDGLSLDVKEGEFFTLLGPSGCGKTTLLRMIAGFNTIEGGDFYFGDKRINDFDPAKRNIGMVFQNYAIFPHLTVEKNVAFGLKNRKIDKQTIKMETNKFLELMQIREFAERLPERLSGGQQQRVALARALVIQPDVLLMDEPLSNLDAKLRVEMRQVIKDIQTNVNITTVYVTHDQEEAMAVSDRIAIMNFGEIQHVGSPKDIYQRPANLFVASFIGQTNILDAQLKVENNQPKLVFENGYELEVNNIRDDYKHDQNVKVSIRPEEFIIASDATGLTAVTENYAFLGLNTVYNVIGLNDQRLQIIQESSIHDIIEPNETVNLKINAEKINIFVEDGSVNIVEGVNNDYDIYNQPKQGQEG
ncbi:MAG: ABC transporter ATP-binding protein [Erysipelothrix sp.]|jgi:iron(III) transport system ATP-binding protein|nr:ABC transporter ATP-binding protein [Erysipelothrix sp.]